MKKHYLLLFTLFLIFTYSCSSDPLDVETVSVETKGDGGSSGSSPSAFDGYKDGPVVLGKDLSAIHSVSMMRAAYNTKYPNGDGQYGPSGIRTTHYYVRFLPKNEDEYDQIVKYNLSEIPLYTEIVKGGSSYHDPSIPADQYTWQYALIPVGDFALGTVRYEMLQNMFIIEDGAPGMPGPGGTPSYTFWEALEKLNRKETTGEDVVPGKSWTPSGKIEVYDDLLKKYIPIVGLAVSISVDGYRTQVVYTDLTGSFKSGWTYTQPVYYKIPWWRKDFQIKDGAKDQAYILSNLSSLPLNVKLSASDSHRKQKNFATIYRAAYRTFTKDYLNMATPVIQPLRGQESRPIRIAYYPGTGDISSGLYHLNAGSLDKTKPNISIWESSMRSHTMFSTVLHELAHAGQHIMFPNYKWTVSNQIIHESWAKAVAYYIMKLEYGDFGMNIEKYENFTISGSAVTYGLTTMRFVIPNGDNPQHWPYCGYSPDISQRQIEYSPLMIDLVDASNQALYFKLSPVKDISYKLFPNDDVYGFELSKIQTALGASNLADFKNKIKTINRQYYSTKNTDIEIDTLFRRYEYYWKK